MQNKISEHCCAVRKNAALELNTVAVFGLHADTQAIYHIKIGYQD